MARDKRKFRPGRDRHTVVPYIREKLNEEWRREIPVSRTDRYVEQIEEQQRVASQTVGPQWIRAICLAYNLDPEKDQVEAINRVKAVLYPEKVNGEL